MQTPVNGEKLRFGLVGVGRIAQTYLQAFGVVTNARVVAVADTRKEAARSVGDAFGCASYGSWDALGEDIQIDAAIVATPPATHAPICEELLSRGIPVLCEKPVSVTLEAALSMRDAAWRSGVLLTMASKFRCVDDVIQAKAILDSGILGEIVLVENTFMSLVDMSARWNADYSISGGGVLIDNGTHSVDIMRYLLGELSEIQVTEGRRTQGLSVEETVRASVRSVAGTIGTMDLSWSLTKETDDYIAIYGSSGKLRIGWKSSGFRLNGGDWVSFGGGYDKVKAFKRQIENFSAAIQGLEQLIVSVDDAIASVEVIQAGYAALREKRWTSIRPGAAKAAAAAEVLVQTA